MTIIKLPKISDFGAVDDEGKRSISLWHKQTPGIPGVDFHLERLYNILQSWRFQPKISDFGAVDDEGKRSISLWHKQTPGIPGVDFHLERLYNILQSWRFQKWPIRTQKPPSRNVPTRTKLKGCLPMRSTSSVRALGMFTFPIASRKTV